MKDKTRKTIIKWWWIILTAPFVFVGFWILLVALFAKIPSFEELENHKSNLATELISCEEIAVHSIQIAIPISIFVLPLDITGPVSAFVIRGMSMPTPDTANAARTIITESLMVR